MDHEHFDALSRLLANRGSRRTALGVLAGVALLGRSSEMLAKPGKGKAKGRDKGQGHGREDAPGRLPDGGGDPGEEPICVATACPRDPATGRLGRCCPGGWCSCGDVCCADDVCWISRTESRGGDTPQVVVRESCAPPTGCVQCRRSGSACCIGCSPAGECMSSGPISGGSIRRR